MNEVEKFKNEKRENIERLSNDYPLKELSHEWVQKASIHNWSYNFSWFGRPAIQFPNDTWAMQELIWEIKPDLIIETGIAHGGSLIFSASMLAMLDYAEAAENKTVLDPSASKRRVLGVDIDIRQHNKSAIEAHPFAGLIQMVEGSSIDEKTVCRVREIASSYKTILVCLDSNHTHEHVLAELKAYAHLVSKGSYCVVFDTLVEDMPAGSFPDRPWGKGNNPKTAVFEYIKANPNFVIDTNVSDKLCITVAPEGFLRRIK
jgi:cephalosporin hydroxylase